jgi:putative ABC transport system permease protein
MIGVALKGLAGRKFRAALTALAIVLGVSMVSGTYVLTDTIDKAFNSIFSDSLKGSDAVISGKVAFSNSNSNTSSTPAFAASVLAKVRQLPDVEAAVGSVGDLAKLVGHNGKVISSGGAPNLAFSVDTKADQRFNPLTLVAGAWPSGPGQIAIDEATSKKKHFAVGDSIGVATQGPTRQFAISGIARFTTVSSIGGATMAIFDVPTAQALFDKVGKFDRIDVAAKPGVSQQQLANEITPLLPATAQVKTAAAQVKEDSKDVDSFIGILQKVLLGFGGVALFVGSFVIANTLSITIAQRVREFATLRTIGASRRQVLGSVILEALVIGFFASVVGLFLGLALAKGLNSLFVAFGIDLPKSGTVFATRTIVVSLLVGTLITLVASLRPALRATRVPPISAVREGAVLPPSRFARLGPVPGLIVLALGIGLLVLGLYGSGGAGPRIVEIVVGFLLVFFGVAQNARRVVRPLASVLGWPATKIGGSAGALARDNSMRNPTRTASTAAALMIGIALVTFVAVIGQGLRSTFEDAVNKQFVADYALTSQNGFDPITKEAASAVAGAPGVETVSSIRAGDGRVFGKTVQVTAVDEKMPKVVRVDWYRGSTAVPGQLGRDGVFVEKKYASKHHLSVGSRLILETPTGEIVPLRVKGISKAPKGGSPFGTVTISTRTFDAAYSQPKNLMTFVNVQGGVSDRNTAQLKLALNAFPDAKIATQSQFKQNQEKGINQLLALLYVLLGLSVIVSLFGIVNTLVLTVFERTRELGMLRAVGMTRRQVRRMVRHESVVTALIGATLGVVVGLFVSGLVANAFTSQGLAFVVPVGSIVAFAIAAIVAGILAAILPARRAARLNVLEALQYE